MSIKRFCFIFLLATSLVYASNGNRPSLCNPDFPPFLDLQMRVSTDFREATDSFVGTMRQEILHRIVHGYNPFMDLFSSLDDAELLRIFHILHTYYKRYPYMLTRSDGQANIKDGGDLFLLKEYDGDLISRLEEIFLGLYFRKTLSRASDHALYISGERIGVYDPLKHAQRRSRRRIRHRRFRVEAAFDFMQVKGRSLKDIEDTLEILHVGEVKIRKQNGSAIRQTLDSLRKIARHGMFVDNVYYPPNRIFYTDVAGTRRSIKNPGAVFQIKILNMFMSPALYKAASVFFPLHVEAREAGRVTHYKFQHALPYLQDAFHQLFLYFGNRPEVMDFMSELDRTLTFQIYMAPTAVFQDLLP